MRFRTPYRGVVCVALGIFVEGCVRARRDDRGAGRRRSSGGAECGAAGDVITLAPGATYVGNFVLPNKGAIDDYITIRSAAPDDAAAAGRRPRHAGRMRPNSRRSDRRTTSPRCGPRPRRTTGSCCRARVPGQPGRVRRHHRARRRRFDADPARAGAVRARPRPRLRPRRSGARPEARHRAAQQRHHARSTRTSSDCKAIGQDSQALSGYNGPGNYLIENNYLEGATENVLFGGADPMIPNLVTGNITFRRNYLRKPLAWRDPIIATPAAVAATAMPGGGSLAAGTYYYKVAARVGGRPDATRRTPSASAEVSATIDAGTTGGVTISWTPVAGADDYWSTAALPARRTCTGRRPTRTSPTPAPRARRARRRRRRSGR